MFPSLSEYNRTIQLEGAKAFRTLKNLTFIPAKTKPIKIFNFGSGSYAVVFKAIENNKEIAVRCFIGSNGDYANRLKKIAPFIRNINDSWKSNIEFIDNEINVNGRWFPVVKMDWVDGLLLDKYINKNLQDNSKLTMLQKQIAIVSSSLEKQNISHGDIQEGNIIIQEKNGNVIIKLIDYDGMFIPEFRGDKQIERGRSEYQHPKRNSFKFDEKIDRFSFWVILCALEALKFDKTLWKETMQGGFNTLSNMLFSASDFIDPNNSELFRRFEKINQKSLNFYVAKIKYALYNNTVENICLYDNNSPFETFDPQKKESINKNTSNVFSDKYSRLEINSNPTGAFVLNSSFKFLGKTPIILNKYDYLNQDIRISSGTLSKSIHINESSNDFFVDLNKVVNKKPEEKSKIINDNYETEKNQQTLTKKNDNTTLIFFSIFVILFFSVILISNLREKKTDYPVAEEVAVDSAAVFVDSFANEYSPPAEEAYAVDSSSATAVDSAETTKNVNYNSKENSNEGSFFYGTWVGGNFEMTFYSNGWFYMKINNDISNPISTEWKFENGNLYIGLGENDEMINTYYNVNDNDHFSFKIEGVNSDLHVYRK